MAKVLRDALQVPRQHAQVYYHIPQDYKEFEARTFKELSAFRVPWRRDVGGFLGISRAERRVPVSEVAQTGRLWWGLLVVVGECWGGPGNLWWPLEALSQPANRP